MFIERLINQGNAPLLQKMMDFTAHRHELIAENIANISTPGYVQKDYSVSGFEKKVRERLEVKKSSAPGTVAFDDVEAPMMDSRTGLLFHDRSNRSAEQLMSDLSSNALRHNLYAELLRKQYDSMKNVLTERVT